jgi:hypothetical protein
VARTYRALIKRGSTGEHGAFLHLIGEDAEASLCGIPRSSLTSGDVFDELVCSDCVDWLRRRNTGTFLRLAKEPNPT